MAKVHSNLTTPGARAILSRAIHFSSAYSYARKGETPVENEAVYGRWSAPDGFGCNFRAECSFEGPVDPLTGMVANLADVDCWLKAAAEEFDHHDLTGHPRMAGAPATADAIARAFALSVRERMPSESGVKLVRVRLREGASSCVDVG